MSRLKWLSYPALLLGSGLVGCSGAEPPTTPVPTAPLTIESGANVSDSVLTRLPVPLSVVLRTSGGAARSGVGIRFDAMPASDATRLAERAIVVAPLATQLFAGSVTDTTDAKGRATVLVQLGTVAGTTGVVVSTQDGLVDTARFTVLPGNATRLTVPVHDTTLNVGESFSLGAVLRDQFQNVRPELPTVTTTQLVDAAVAVGTGNQVSATKVFGRARLGVAADGLSDSAFVSVVPTGTVAVTTGDPLLGLEIIDLDGKNGRLLSQLVSEQLLVPEFPDWAPDGSSIAVQGVSGDGYFAAATMDTLGAYRFIVPQVFGLRVGPARYSSDGQWLYYSRSATQTGPVELWRVHPDGSGAVKLFTPAAGAVNWTDPRPTPDGRYLFVNGFDPNPGAAARLDLTTGSATQFPGRFYDPAYSAVADLVVMETADAQLAIAKSDGTQFRMLTSALSPSTGDGSQSWPSWSPDGNWIVARSSKLGALVVVRVTDGAFVPILRGRNLAAAAWRPR